MGKIILFDTLRKNASIEKPKQTEKKIVRRSDMDKNFVIIRFMLHEIQPLIETLDNYSVTGVLWFEYSALADKAAMATAIYNALSAQIKSAERRLADITVLKTHIINYFKTRDTYVAYRIAGYSKKFLTEHECDILLHKAAKKAFDELGMKKLPTVRSLQVEYSWMMHEMIY